MLWMSRFPIARVLAWAVVLPVLPSSLTSQSSVSAADSLLAAGDSAGAIRVLDQWIKRHGRDAEARYRLGTLHFAAFTTGQPVSAARRAAEEQFRMATRLQPDSAKYWLALAEVYRTQTDVTVRAQVAGVIDRALAAARRHGGGVLAQAEYRAARIDWERYEQNANRYRLGGEIGEVDHDAFLNDWEYVEELFARRLRPESRGWIEWRAAEEHLQAALRADPVHVAAAGLLIVALGELHRWDSAAAVARRLVDVLPARDSAWTLYGLALARAGRWQDAESAFDSAFAHMTAVARAPYDNLPSILSPEDAARFAASSDTERSVVRASYWTRADPLWLTTTNEVRVEFYARLVYADHRWSDEYRGYRGWESDRGAVYARYGPPDITATLGPGGVETDRVVVVADPSRQRDPFFDRLDAAERLDRERNRVLWVYRASRLRYLFTLAPGYARAVFGGAAAHTFLADQRRVPTTNDNVPAADVDSIALVVAQFRAAEDGNTDVAVFGRLPSRPAPETVAALLVRSSPADSLSRADTLPRGTGAILAGRVALAPGRYGMRLEAVDPAAGRAARGATALDVRSFVGPEPAASDLLAVSALESAGHATRWDDLTVEPVFGALATTRPLGLLWEVYGLASDAQGNSRYRVELRIEVESVARRGFVARIVGGIGDALGISAEGDDAVRLDYERVAPSAVAQLEYLLIDLGDAPAGTYSVEIQITDAVTGRVVPLSTRLTRR